MEIHKLITSIWKKEKLPEEWKESIIVPIHKKRDKTDNIRMDLQEVGCGYKDWIGLAQDRDRQVAYACKCGNEPWGSVKCGEFLD